jgi:hypothetical protein
LSFGLLQKATTNRVGYLRTTHLYVVEMNQDGLSENQRLPVVNIIIEREIKEIKHQRKYVATNV